MTETKFTPVDINRASLDELVTISGIGPGLAKGIIEMRPYYQIDDLVRVPGINSIKLASLKPFITVQEKQVKSALVKPPIQVEPISAGPVAKLGNTEAFVFLEDRNERQDALLIIFGGFIFGLIILMLRRSSR